MDRLAEWKGRLDQLATATDAMSARIQELRVTVADGNGLVEVTVDAVGALVDLKLGQRVQRVAPDVVARTIMTTIDAAKRQLADRAVDGSRDVEGPEGAHRTIRTALGEAVRRGHSRGIPLHLPSRPASRIPRCSRTPFPRCRRSFARRHRGGTAPGGR